MIAQSNQLEGQIIARELSHVVVRLSDGTEVNASLPNDRKFGCLFGTLVGWNVKVVLKKAPRLARIVELRMPS